MEATVNLFNVNVQPDPKNKLSWSTPGSVEKNLPSLTRVHAALLSSPNMRTVLEIASGFGDHMLAYARTHREIDYWPTECNEYLVVELHKRILKHGTSNIKTPRVLDILEESDWAALRQEKSTPFDLVIVTNLLNVAPWCVTQALFHQIGKRDQCILHAEHGILSVYGCLKQNGKFLSKNDEKFDAELRSRDPEFGVRDLEEIVLLAQAQNLKLDAKDAPEGGTNLCLQFRFTS